MDTRQNLLKCATHLFASGGFDAISNRHIANEADVNQALIGYHFRNKRGLYNAVIEQMVDDLSVQMEPVRKRLHNNFAELVENSQSLSDLQRRSGCIENISTLLCAQVRLLMKQELEDYAKLIMREQLEPSSGFTILWEGYLEKQLKLLTQLVALCNNNKKPVNDDRLQALTLMSQAIIFRVARATVSMQMNWSESLNEGNISTVERHIRNNVKCILKSQNQM
ncbi:MAG: AcrR family transcriptional regulator [bacterium]|jgi:AcrR family transcriptional regulator